MNAIPTRLSQKLRGLLDEQFGHLEDFAIRLNHVSRTHAELVLVTREELFRIQSIAAWRMIQSTRNMVIVDMSSWVKGLCGRGGFFRQLRGDDLKALALKWTKSDIDNKWRRDAFERLFPGAIGRGHPCGTDIDVLGKRLLDEFEPLLDERNWRSHFHEKEGRKARADELRISEAAKHLEACGVLMRDVFCLATNSSHFTDHVRPKPDDPEAQDLVDLILLGTMRWILDGDPSKAHAPTCLYYWQRRLAHYDRLHATYATMVASSPELAFNDPAVSLAAISAASAALGA